MSSLAEAKIHSHRTPRLNPVVSKLFLPDVDSALSSNHEAGAPRLPLGGPELPQLLLPAQQHHQEARAADGGGAAPHGPRAQN